jgi:hypothetical protein
MEKKKELRRRGSRTNRRRVEKKKKKKEKRGRRMEQTEEWNRQKNEVEERKKQKQEWSRKKMEKNEAEPTHIYKQANTHTHTHTLTSLGRTHATKPPTIVHPLVINSKSGIFFSKLPFTNCAAIDPNLPPAAKIPMAEVRSAVGNDSHDKQSREFQPITENALNSDAQVITTKRLDVSSAKPRTEMPARHIPTDCL